MESTCLPQRGLRVKRMAKVMISFAFSLQLNLGLHRNCHILLAGLWIGWFSLSSAGQHFRDMLKYPRDPKV